MARVSEHLAVDELQVGYRTSGDATLARHYQVIWLLAQGRTCAEVAELTSFAVRWVEQLLERYNAFGPRSHGDRRRGNGAAATVLTREMLDKLRERLKAPPDDGGVWTSKKVAAFMAGELGRSVSEQRGWEALRAVEWTPQRPRPRHAGVATPEEQAASKRTRRGGRGGSGAPSRRHDRGLRHRGLSGIPCSGGHSGREGDPACPDANHP